MAITKKQHVIEFVAKYSIYFITLLFMIICTIINPRFLSVANLTNVLRQICVYAMIAFGQSVLLISGNLDLSAGSTCCISGIIGVFAYVASGNLLVASLAAMLCGVVIGTVSGCIISLFSLPPFVATLGMQMAVRGMCYVITGGATITRTGENFRYIGQGFIGPFPVSIIIMLGFAVVLWLILDRTTLGRRLYALGGNREAARACGIDLRKHTVIAYMLSGVFIGMAGIIYASRINAGAPTGCQGYEGQGISAAVIGGIGFAGGTGSAWGAIIGAVVLGIINNILNLMGVDSYIQDIVNGMVIIIAVALDTYTRRLRVAR